jgi:GT2 family glycosyltransferase
MKSASIVIITYNRPYSALLLAKKIRRFDNNIEIIIVDQAKTSKITKRERKLLKINYVNLEEPSVSIARNKGIEKAHGEIVIFLDDDVEITKRTIHEHIKAYSNPKIICVTGRVINDDDKFPKNIKVETGKTNFLGTKFSLNFWSTQNQYVDFPYGCNMSFRKNILIEIGMFDKKYDKYFEEVDLGARLKKKHYLIKFEPKALVYHHQAKVGGARSSNPHGIFYDHYGYYLAKNVPFPFSLISLFIRTITVLKQYPKVIVNLYSGYFNYFINILNR